MVCAGIHMSDIPSFPYRILWEERMLRSVANLTRRDGLEFLEVAPRVPVHTEVEVYPLESANEALSALRADASAAAWSSPSPRPRTKAWIAVRGGHRMAAWEAACETRR